MPFVSDLYIGQIADNETFGFGLLKLAIQDIRCRCFVTGRFRGIILSNGIGRNQSLLIHDAPNATSGYDETLFLKFDLKFSIP